MQWASVLSNLTNERAPWSTASERPKKFWTLDEAEDNLRCRYSSPDPSLTHPLHRFINETVYRPCPRFT